MLRMQPLMRTQIVIRAIAVHLDLLHNPGCGDAVADRQKQRDHEMSTMTQTP